MRQAVLTFLTVGLLLLLNDSCRGNIIRLTFEESEVEPKKLVHNEAPKAVEFSFAKHFQDHMVLQKEPARANIYGFSPNIGATVSLSVHFNLNYSYYTAMVNPGTSPGIGVWSVLLNAKDGGTSVNITAQSQGQVITLSDVIFGDVWICSGQSNMQFTTIQMYDAAAEIADAHNYPNIRLMTVSEKASDTPLSDLIEIQQNWTSPNNASVGGPEWQYFSAVCWLYGKAIHKALGYPIGLVATDWGGTPVEAWSSPEALAKCGIHSKTKGKQSDSLKKLNKLSSKAQRYLVGPNDNSALWNAMIYPFLNMTIYGAIWYQGEADASGSRMNNYNCTFPTMITDWRQNFNFASGGQTSATFPFGFVQLAPNSPDPSITVGFPDIRWHQTADFGAVPNPKMVNVFMAVAMDLPDFNSTYGSIHPRDKIDVGNRLSLGGLAVAYGRSEVFQGPLPTATEQVSGNLRIFYGDTWNLEIRNSTGFELLCTNNTWVPAAVVGNDNTSVTIQYVCPQEDFMQGIRYAWRESPCSFKKCAVYETVNGLPGPPFIALFSNGNANFAFKDPVYI